MLGTYAYAFDLTLLAKFIKPEGKSALFENLTVQPTPCAAGLYSTKPQIYRHFRYFDSSLSFGLLITVVCMY